MRIIITTNDSEPLGSISLSDYADLTKDTAFVGVTEAIKRAQRAILSRMCGDDGCPPCEDAQGTLGTDKESSP